MSASQNVLFITTLPKSVEQLSKQLHSKIVDPVILQTLIDLAIRYWKGEDINHSEWEAVVKHSYLPQTLLEELFSGVLNLTMAVFRIPENIFTPDLVCGELVKIGFTSDQAEYMAKLRNISTPNIPKFMKLNDVKWRIDVTISTSAVSRILEPWILMEFDLGSDGQKTIHIPLAQFHSLRYQVASLLNQLGKLPV